MELLKAVEKQFDNRKEFPEFTVGDTITVHYKIKEGNKERIQNFLRIFPVLKTVFTNLLHKGNEYAGIPDITKGKV